MQEADLYQLVPGLNLCVGEFIVTSLSLVQFGSLAYECAHRKRRGTHEYQLI